jgi:adenylylsulfate kinase
MTVKSSNKRTVLKGLTWRVISLALTMVIVYFLTGSIDGALKIGAVDFVIKFAIYFGHEKAWKLTDWGKVSVPCEK